MNLKRISLIAMLAVILTVFKQALSALPNIELITFSIILFSLVIKWDTIYVVIVFNVIQGLFYGFGTWWIGYMVVWPLLSIVTIIFRKIFTESNLARSILAAGVGITMGIIFALPYVVLVNPWYAVTTYISGIPFSMVHMVSNYFIMMVLGTRILLFFGKLTRRYYNK